jgi:hypothetical protein
MVAFIEGDQPGEGPGEGPEHRGGPLVIDGTGVFVGDQGQPPESVMSGVVLSWTHPHPQAIVTVADARRMSRVLLREGFVAEQEVLLWRFFTEDQELGHVMAREMLVDWRRFRDQQAPK